MRLLLRVSSALALAVSAAPVTAQSSDQTFAVCLNWGREAISACTAAIESGKLNNASLATAFFRRAMAFTFRGDDGRALADLNEAIRLDPNGVDKDAYSHRGRLREKLKDYAGAISDYSEALRRKPGYISALSDRAGVYALQKDYTRAIADYSDAIRLDPSGGYSGVFHGRGEAYEAQQHYARAVEDYDRAVSLDPDNADYRNHACWVRAAFLGRELDRAREDCDVAVRLSPNDTAYLDSRGMVGLKQGRYQDAWNDYDAASRIKPSGPYYWYGRGIAALRLGRAAEGEADIAKARSIDSRIAEKWTDYGIRP